jgi:hypothetical protein
MSDNTIEQRQQSSLTLLYVSYQKKIVCQKISQKKDINF